MRRVTHEAGPPVNSGAVAGGGGYWQSLRSVPMSPGDAEGIDLRALVYDRFGTADELRIDEVERPAPGPGEVLVRVHAASLNSWDVDNLFGRPKVLFLFQSRPKLRVLGADMSGIVEAVGEGVTAFRPGDGVMGDISECRWGGFADYAVACTRALILKPVDMNFIEAAALPQAGLLAWQAMRDWPMGPGKRVLINGGGGGVGTFALRLASARGAHVTGVDSATKAGLMRDCGADETIDYRQQDYTSAPARFDFILDMVAHRPARAYRRALKPGGRFSVVGGGLGRILAVALTGRLFAGREDRQLSVLVLRPNGPDIEELTRLHAEGVRPEIGHVMPLEQGPEAFRMLAAGEARGKIVLEIAR